MEEEDETVQGSGGGGGLLGSPEESGGGIRCWTKNKGEQGQQGGDKFLPIANVGRIMKKAIPGGGKISKEAKETVQECVSEFISFVTGEASDKCQRERRKTINGDDILWAITTLGFHDYVSPLKTYLNKYRDLEPPPKHPLLLLPPDQHQHTAAYSPAAYVSSDQYPYLNNLHHPFPPAPIHPQFSTPQQEHIHPISHWQS